MSEMHKRLSIADFFKLQSQNGNQIAEKIYPVFSSIVNATIQIYHTMQNCGIYDTIGFTGNENSSGDQIRKLDEIADELIHIEFAKNPAIAAIAGEENEFVLNFNRNKNTAEYVVCYDPLDGSMNSDVNLTTGSIFSILPFIQSAPDIESSFLRTGDSQLSAIYSIYGVALKLVFTIGNGVFEFTYSQSANDFYLSNSQISIPKFGFQYSCNEANSEKWDSHYREYLHYIKNNYTSKSFISRYLATVVADVHRIIYKGGIYLYPPSTTASKGKIRLCYEANPLAFIVEQSGGLAITDTGRRIMETLPESLHCKTPFFIGSPENVNEFREIALSADNQIF